MDLELGNKVAVIMGGTSGVGLAVAKRLLDEGARVAICGRAASKLQMAESLLRQSVNQAADRVLAMTCDATDVSMVHLFIEAVGKAYGGIDVLVNSAGGSLMKSFFELTQTDWMDQINLKYFAVIYAVQESIPYLKQSTAPRIININSTLAREANEKLVATGATRAGLLNLTKSLALELAPYEILVNSVSLGVIRSDQWERRRQSDPGGGDADVWYQQLASSRRIPLGRVGLPREVADVIAFMASARSSYVTGTCIEVDGGMSRYV